MQQLIIAIYTLATSSALIFIKLATKNGTPVSYAAGKLHFNINFYTIAGIVLYVTSFILYIYLISRYSLGYIIPLVTGLVYVLVFAGSFFIFNESFTIAKSLGIALIITGVVVLNLNK